MVNVMRRAWKIAKAGQERFDENFESHTVIKLELEEAKESAWMSVGGRPEEPKTTRECFSL